MAKMVPHVTPRGNGGVCTSCAGEVRRVTVPAAVSAGPLRHGPLPPRIVPAGPAAVVICRVNRWAPWFTRSGRQGQRKGAVAEFPEWIRELRHGAGALCAVAGSPQRPVPPSALGPA
ncbi:hypothetical protein GCM10010270_45850 [Streptomyces violaceus]|nr:hypothetical protein GCM10010270_45850 [Streptomyces janthinus]